MKTKGRCDIVQIGVLYIKRTFGNGCICSMAINGFQEMAKLRQKSFVKIDNEKVAETLQILL
jgi:hypothetical protein